MSQPAVGPQRRGVSPFFAVPHPGQVGDNGVAGDLEHPCQDSETVLIAVVAGDGVDPRLAVELALDCDVEAAAVGYPDNRGDATNEIASCSHSLIGDAGDIGQEFEVDAAVSAWQWTSMA